MPQADAAYPHRYFRDARYVTINGFFYTDTDAATRVTNEDAMKGALESIYQADGRYYFTPSGKAQRFLVVRLYGEFTITDDTTSPFLKNFSIPLIAYDPTIYSALETDTQLTPGTPVTITNNGNRKSFPVIEIAPGAYPAYTGSTVTGFTITNSTTAQAIVAGDHAANPLLVAGLGIPSGHSGEIICGPVHQSFYQDRSGANLLGSISMLETDFIYLAPGPNVLTITGAYAYVKSNDGFA